MLEGIGDRTFYGNTISQWVTALAIVVAAVLVGKLAYWLCGNVIKKVTWTTRASTRVAIPSESAPLASSALGYTTAIRSSPWTVKP